MGKPSRDKGARREREIVALLNSIASVSAERVPLSGACGGSYSGDISMSIDASAKVANPMGTMELLAEVKARKNGEGFKVLEGWLAENDMLILKRDRTSPMVVLPWGTFERLVG
ncbi:MAG: hypothetical protein VCB25_05085 [Myxococcota bacterium]